MSLCVKEREKVGKSGEKWEMHAVSPVQALISGMTERPATAVKLRRKANSRRRCGGIDNLPEMGYLIIWLAAFCHAAVSKRL